MKNCSCSRVANQAHYVDGRLRSHRPAIQRHARATAVVVADFETETMQLGDRRDNGQAEAMTAFDALASGNRAAAIKAPKHRFGPCAWKTCPRGDGIES